MTWFSPRVATLVVVVLALVMVLDVMWAATHHRVETRLEPCALVLTASGHSCR